jgi:hypothetical protein
MNKGISTYVVFAVIPVFISCTRFREQGDVRIARVDQDVLFLSELKDALPGNLSPDDSILFAEDFVRNWISNELMIKKAQENLTISQRDLARELRDYRNSLIIYRYQKALVQEKLDTGVTWKELAQMYDSVKQDFILDSDLVKAVLVRIPHKVANPERVKAFCETSATQNLEELKQFCLKNGASCEISPENWMDAKEVFMKIPYQPANIPGFLSRYTTWEARDSGYYYLVSIQDYALSGSFAPADFIRSNLKNLILNKRKNAFLHKIKEDIYTEGLKNNRFKIYDYETN